MTAAKNAVYWVITWKLLLSGREIDLWWEGNKNLVCMGGIFLVGGGGGWANLQLAGGLPPILQ